MLLEKFRQLSVRSIGEDRVSTTSCYESRSLSSSCVSSSKSSSEVNSQVTQYGKGLIWIR